MKLFLGLSLLGFATAAYDYSIPDPFDYSKTFAGSKRCALINIMMDESGSMSGDQAFMKGANGAKKIVDLFTKDGFAHTFVCAHGYGHYLSHGKQAIPRTHGCGDWSITQDTSFMDWIAAGGYEDSWNATIGSMKLTPSVIDGIHIHAECKGLKKQVILVTDEDSDYHKYTTVTQSEVMDMLDKNGFALNVIGNVEIKDPAEPSAKILGMSQSKKDFDAVPPVATLYKYDSSAASKYSVVRGAQYTLRSKSGNSVNHYYPMIGGRIGALWNIGYVRDKSLVDGMSSALADIKLAEAKKVPESGPTIPGGGSGGDPHFTTWKGEHYEYHGQCDMVLAKDAKFANGAGLDLHLRTKIVRFWSYIKNAAVRIGNDILEVEGSAEPSNTENRYWINFEYQGELKEVGGFPVSVKIQSPIKRVYEIDLDKQYPGMKIVMSTYKEFIRVRIDGGDADSLGNTVGLLGDFNTGKTLARDGATVLDDFSELGNEWQVMPSEPKLFHEIDHPQFPEKCIEPEDPRGERRRRLAENTVTEEAAEAACARLTDAADRKDCVYDILATQDMGMVGAY